MFIIIKSSGISVYSGSSNGEDTSSMFHIVQRYGQVRTARISGDVEDAGRKRVRFPLGDYIFKLVIGVEHHVTPSSLMAGRPSLVDWYQVSAWY